MFWEYTSSHMRVGLIMIKGESILSKYAIITQITPLKFCWEKYYKYINSCKIKKKRKRKIQKTTKEGKRKRKQNPCLSEISETHKHKHKHTHKQKQKQKHKHKHKSVSSSSIITGNSRWSSGSLRNPMHSRLSPLWSTQLNHCCVSVRVRVCVSISILNWIEWAPHAPILLSINSTYLLLKSLSAILLQLRLTSS